MDNLNFITDGTLDRINKPRIKMAEIAHEGFVRKLKHCQDDMEALLDYCRDLKRCGFNVNEELDSAETFARALVLAVLLLKREHSVTPE